MGDRTQAAKDDFENELLVSSIPVAIGALITLVVVLLLIAGVVTGINSAPTSKGVAPGIDAIGKLGPVGDYVGGLLNPFIAICAFAGLLKSISIQRETLRKTREDARRQLDQENFYELLRSRDNSVNSIEWKERDGTIIRGRAAIKEILNLVHKYAKDVDLNEIAPDLATWQIPEELPPHLKKRVALFAILYTGQAVSEEGAWSQYVLEEEHELDNLEELLGHIFRSTYQILKFIYTSPSFDRAKKEDLVNYLRAQMSEVEFLAFALTGCTSIGVKSRALAISLNLYERRLHSIYWATGLRDLFDPTLRKNSELASRFKYPVLSE